MDLRAYYQKLREAEESLTTPHCIIVSLGTPDGGKPGVVTETPTSVAARMVIEGSARPATEAEIEEFREKEATARQTAEEAMAASKLQVVVVPAGRTPQRGGRDH